MSVISDQTAKIAASVIVLENVGKALGKLLAAATVADFVASYAPVLTALADPAFAELPATAKASIHAGAKQIVLALVPEAADLVARAETAESLLEQLALLAPTALVVPTPPTPAEPTPTPVVTPLA